MVKEREKKPTRVERIKVDSNFLRGTLKENYSDESSLKFTIDNVQILKFHGIYQQKDRDAKREKGQKDFDPNIMMLRIRVPGGETTTKQWLRMANLAEKYGNRTLKITTRQAYQLHYIKKNDLKPVIMGINDAMMDTYAACGDVNRNVMCHANPLLPTKHLNEILEIVRDFSDYFTPRSKAYQEVWLNGNHKETETSSDEGEPIYGDTYLPRKFKMVFAVPPYNDVDIYAHDLGLIAIIENDEIIGYNVTVGGGMGMTHNNEDTYPRLADVIGFCEKKDLRKIAEAVLTTQRDFGDRTNRLHARMKYTIEDMGLEKFVAEVEKRSGVKLSKSKEFKFDTNGDIYGWQKGENNLEHYTLFVEGGRAKDKAGKNYFSGIKEIAEKHEGIFYLTANQNFIIANVKPENKETINQILAKHGIANYQNLTGMRLNALSCVGLPTCGLAITESERYLPDLISEIEDALIANGLEDLPIKTRMTACPNGCARPYLAEIAFVGRSPNKYHIFLGGAHDGSRLNKLYKESVESENLKAEIFPIIEQFATEKLDGETFGDFVTRKKIV